MLAAPELVLSASELTRAHYAELAQAIATLDRAEPLQIAVTEYNVSSFFAAPGVRARLRHPSSRTGPRRHAAHLRATRNRPGRTTPGDRVRRGSATILFEPWYNPFTDDGAGGVIPRSSYVATKLIADHLLGQHVGLTGSGPDALFSDGTLSYQYPLVQAAAFVRNDTSEASLVLLNRDLAQARTVTIDLAGYRLAAATQYAPPDLVTNVGSTPIALSDTDARQLGNRLQVTLPPHSLVGVLVARP